MVTSLQALFKRDLNRLTTEIEAYKAPENVWKLAGEISNSGGNLCMHLTGNLQHFIGQVLGQSGYVRNREAEFSATNVPRQELLTEIANTQKVVSQTLATLTPEQLAATYPIEVFGQPMTTEFFLMHLSGHLMYHLGQINYHRRLLDV